MSAALTLAATAVPFIFEQVNSYTTGCEVILQNESDLCFFHHNSLDIYGQILTGKLPTVPPVYYGTEHSFYFDEAVGLVNGPALKAPCSVLIWKIDKLAKYLIVYVYMGNLGDNSGYVDLVDNEKVADEWYENNKNNWVKYSELPHNCNKDFYNGNYALNVEMDNSKHCKLTVTITQRPAI